jgi:hypothetical protein
MPQGIPAAATKLGYGLHGCWITYAKHFSVTLPTFSD